MADLTGMKAICGYVNRSESTVLGWIRDLDFPAKKIGGIWESKTELVNDWKTKFINGSLSLNGGEKKKPKKKKESKWAA